MALTPEQLAQQAEKEVAFLRWMAERAQLDVDAIKAELPLLRQDIERLIAERDAAEEDNAVLLAALRDIEYGCDWMPERLQRLLNRISEAGHPGRELMGELTRRMSDLEHERDEAEKKNAAWEATAGGMADKIKLLGDLHRAIEASSDDEYQPGCHCDYCAGIDAARRALR